MRSDQILSYALVYGGPIAIVMGVVLLFVNWRLALIPLLIGVGMSSIFTLAALASGWTPW